jgi:hypothetical protein
MNYLIRNSYRQHDVSHCLPPQPKKEHARNIILLIGDGMGISQVTAALGQNCSSEPMTIPESLTGSFVRQRSVNKAKNNALLNVHHFQVIHHFCHPCLIQQVSHIRIVWQQDLKQDELQGHLLLQSHPESHQ